MNGSHMAYSLVHMKTKQSDNKPKQAKALSLRAVASILLNASPLERLAFLEAIDACAKREAVQTANN